METKAFENFVSVQSDAALRQLAGRYNYDENSGQVGELTLRSGADEINDELTDTLNECLAIAGIEAVEARINYLAYAPEIAAVMLRRQQADAIIAAREKIVDGAVSMVKMALERLKDTESKSFLLRIDTATMEALEHWASDEFRSMNGQLQWNIADALKRAGRSPKK